MNPVIPLNRCFEQMTLLAQAAPDHHGTWLSVAVMAFFVAVVAVYAFMRLRRKPDAIRSEIENPPGDPLAVARKNEEEFASANVRASDQTR